MHMGRIPVQNLDELNKTSDAVIVGRVIATGAVHFILPSGEQPHAFQPSAAPKDLPKDKIGAGKTPELGRFQPNIITPPAGMPVTDFTIEVSQVMRDGSGVAKGSRITVSQPGGVVQIPLGQGAPTLTRTMLAEHDALMVQGQEHVLFLQKAGNGFVVTGGPDGRFKLDAKRTLQPIDEGSPVGLAHKGETIDGLQSKINNNRGIVRTAGD
jgi:hypothetical protein